MAPPDLVRFCLYCDFVIASVICMPQTAGQERGILEWQVAGSSAQMMDQPEQYGVPSPAGSRLTVFVPHNFTALNAVHINQRASLRSHR